MSLLRSVNISYRDNYSGPNDSCPHFANAIAEIEKARDVNFELRSDNSALYAEIKELRAENERLDEELDNSLAEIEELKKQLEEKEIT